ncbi:hypothetical protein ABT009_02590 [Streptomyces sp. NPDC002896]
MPDAIPTWFFDLKALAAQTGHPELPEQVADEHHPLDEARHNGAKHQ